MNKNLNLLEEYKQYDIEWLKDNTTIVRVFSNNEGKVIYGDDFHICRYKRDQGQPVSLETYEKFWNNKFDQFGNDWSEERSNYRLLYATLRLFWFSFEQLRYNKVSSINEYSKNHKKMIYLNEIAGVNVYGLYLHGKKCIDLLTRLKLIVSESDKVFLSKFRGTRNYLIEHNYKPHDKNLICEPSTWSLLSTDSLLETHINTKEEERVFDVCFDYYEDYYKLEQIIVGKIEKF